MSRKPRKVAGSCLEFLMLALVQDYARLAQEQGWDTPTLHDKLQSIGEHLGIRVIEKFVS